MVVIGKFPKIVHAGGPIATLVSGITGKGNSQLDLRVT